MIKIVEADLNSKPENYLKTMTRGLRLDRNRIKCITQEIRQLQSRLENDKSNERVDQHPMLKPHEVKDEYWTPKPIPKPYFMDR